MEDTMMRLMKKLTRVRPSPTSPPIRRAFPRLEALESRVVPYVTSGNLWPNPQLITLSFVPDGTNLGGVTSNLFATFNAKWATSTWENQILKAAQVWAQQTNINFSLIPDSGASEGSGNYQQGDPTMGDIRISGFNFGTSALGEAFMPPSANNYSIAGDISFNTRQTFSIGYGGYDLFTAAAHEIGHALGLYHSTACAAIMYGTYNAMKSGLNCDDIAGIRNIYSANAARSYDAFNGTNTSFSAAADLTGLIDANGNVLETGLDIATTSLKEYFTITAPSDTNGTMTVTVQSQGLSLLAPTLTVYNSSQTQIGYVSGAGQHGTTLTLNITGVSAGQQLYIKVAGADSTAFGTGNYALTFSFAGNTPPTAPLPNTQVLDGNLIQGGGGQNLNGGGGLTHGTGCNCPACQAARAAMVQQIELRHVLMAASQKEHEKSLASAIRSRAPLDGLLSNPDRQAVTQAFTFVLSSQAANGTGLASNGDSPSAASWTQSCDALFSAWKESSTKGLVPAAAIS
jgi:hypothetical protein